MPQYKGSVTRRENKNFQNNIQFPANLSRPDNSRGCYARFRKDVVKVGQSALRSKKKGRDEMRGLQLLRDAP
jgi:hypothetical protein